MISGVTSNLSAGNSSSSTKPPYLEDLAVIADSADRRSASYGKYTNEQILDASKKLNEREYAAFMHLSTDASTTGIKKYAEAYIRYYDQLSPEEQNSPRYKGTRESVSNLLSQANAQLSAEKAHPDKKAEEPTSFILMLLDSMNKHFETHGVKGQNISGNPSRTEDKVTLSEEARKLSVEK